jgi:hypothetical protein
MAMDCGAAAGALEELDRVRQAVLDILARVKAEAPEEHLGYVSLVVPAMVAAFSMSAMVWRACPELDPPESDPEDGPDYRTWTADDFLADYYLPPDDSYRYANTMTLATARTIWAALADLSSLAGEAAELLAAACTAEEGGAIPGLRSSIDETLAAIRDRLEAQHPGVAAGR